MATKIKICGITNLKDARAAVKLGADALGFILAPSPRRVTLSAAKKIIKMLPPFITTVAVVVNEKKDRLDKIIKTKAFDLLQLHGEETPQQCNYLKNKIKLIKTFRIKNKGSLKYISDYKIKAILLDTFVKEKYGGTGAIFNWALVKLIKSKNYSLVLSGGLNPKNVGLAIRKIKPYAVDVSSSVEKYPGKKDLALLKKFITEVKKTDELVYN